MNYHDNMHIQLNMTFFCQTLYETEIELFNIKKTEIELFNIKKTEIELFNIKKSQHTSHVHVCNVLILQQEAQEGK